MKYVYNKIGQEIDLKKIPTKFWKKVIIKADFVANCNYLNNSRNDLSFNDKKDFLKKVICFKNDKKFNDENDKKKSLMDNDDNIIHDLVEILSGWVEKITEGKFIVVYTEIFKDFEKYNAIIKNAQNYIEKKGIKYDVNFDYFDDDNLFVVGGKYGDYVNESDFKKDKNGIMQPLFNLIKEEYFDNMKINKIYLIYTGKENDEIDKIKIDTVLLKLEQENNIKNITYDDYC